MIEVRPGLYVGAADDYEYHVAGESGWTVVHACKEPYHRQALGYSGRAVAKDHPEYLWAVRGNRLCMNLVDVDNPAYVARELVDAALDFIDAGRARGDRVLVHCNQGLSRSPSLALLSMAARSGDLAGRSFAEAVMAFREIYPQFAPSPGMFGFLVANWASYTGVY